MRPLSHRLTRLLAAGAATIALACGAGAGPVASPAAATEFGMSDGRPVLFDAPHLHELNFTRVRLVVPWNAANRSGTWDRWLERAALQGFPAMVSMNIDEAGTCEAGAGGSCTGPSVDAYSAALRKLLARYPGIDAVEAWNEPNQGDQPTANDASLAARYFDAASAACGGGRCTAVAGNMLDSPGMAYYLGVYRAALRTTPAVWGIHDYADATYFGRSGLDQMLAVTSGPVWITEVGGLVELGAAAGGLEYDEHRAADSLRWMFSLAAKTPRLQRMYLYGMWQEPHNGFDSALLRVDNSERESMAVARAAIGPRQVRLPGPQAPLLPSEVAGGSGSGASGAGGSAGGSFADGRVPAHARLPSGAAASALSVSGRLRLDGKRAEVTKSRRISVLVRCVGTTTCVGRFQVIGTRWAYTRRLTVAAGGTRRLKVRVPARVMRTVKVKATARTFARVCTNGQPCAKQLRVGLVRRS